MALNIADLFEHAADAFPDRIAVACGDSQVTYRELDERSNRLAHHLASLGVGPGAHVGMYARNSIEALETLLATYKLRARTVNINYRYVESELRYMFTDADLVALVYDREFAPLVSVVLPDAPGILGTVVIGGTADDRAPGVPYDDALAGASNVRDFGPRSGDDIYLLYTGGTTGYPKGVLWRQRDVWRTLGGGIDFLTGEPLADEWVQSRTGAAGSGLVKLCPAPLIHGSAQWTSLMSLFTGDTVVLLPSFDSREIWHAVERHKVNVIVVVGDAMARPLIEAYAAGGYDASSVVSMSSNGALFSQSVKDAVFAALPNVVVTDAIGSSETGFTGLSFASAGGEQRGGPTVSPGPATIVIDDDGKRAGPGQVGRIARGGHIPLGYYKDSVKTAAMFVEVDGDRYVVPGDFARVEEDGTITLLGRGSACVNTGGEKVFPEEVESALKRHPAVFDALVIGIPDERLGQQVAAIVQPRGGQEIDLADLESVVRGHVAGYKVPRTVWITDSIGRTPSGKVDYMWARKFADARLAARHAVMTLRTSLCDRLGVEHPICGFTPSEHVAAAISRAGGLGVLGCVRYNDAADLEAALTWMDANTDGRPYGVDIVMPAKVPAEGSHYDLGQLIPAGHKEFVDQTLLRLGVPPLAADDEQRDGVLGWLHSVARAHVEVALAHPVALIANALGSPPDDVIASAHSQGIAVAALAGKAEHAQRHVSQGVDIVVAQGYEAGGHTGEIASMVLVPEIVDAVGSDVPVLAAGGIGSGRQIVAALSLGAVGVWMGSFWLTTQEYALGLEATALRAALLAATSSDTVRSRIYSGKPARLLKNKWTQAWDEPGAPEPLPMPLQNLLVSEAHQRLMQSGDPEVVPMPVGQIVGRMNSVKPVADVMSDLVAQADEALSRLGKLR